MRHPLFDPAESERDLARRSARGGLYTAAAQVTNTLLMLLTTVVVARFLTPDDYGIVVFATVFTGFASLFTNAGLELPTIQAAEIDEQKVSNLFWLSLLVGAVVSLATLALAPLVAYLLDDPRQIAIVSVLAPLFIVSGAASQHRALMIRTYRNLRLAMIDVAANVIGTVTGIALAVLTQSYWALVWMLLSVTLARSALILLEVRWRPRGPSNLRGSFAEATFGASVTGYNLINYVSRSADNFLIGWQRGYEELGLYDRAYKLLLAPIRQLNAPLTNVTLATLSRLVDDPPRYRRAYLTILKLLLLVSMPVSAFAVFHNELVIALLLGPQWSAVVPIFAWLGVAGLGQSVFSSLGWLYISQGRSKDYLRWGVFGCVAHVGAFAIGIAWGALGVAISYCIVFYLLILPVGFHLVGRSGPVAALDLLRALRAPALLSGAVVASTAAADLLAVSLPAPLRLIALGLVAAATCLLYVLLDRPFFEKVRGTLRGAPGAASSAATPGAPESAREDRTADKG